MDSGGDSPAGPWFCLFEPLRADTPCAEKRRCLIVPYQRVPWSLRVGPALTVFMEIRVVEAKSMPAFRAGASFIGRYKNFMAEN